MPLGQITSLNELFAGQFKHIGIVYAECACAFLRENWWIRMNIHSCLDIGCSANYFREILRQPPKSTSRSRLTHQLGHCEKPRMPINIVNASITEKLRREKMSRNNINLLCSWPWTTLTRLFIKAMQIVFVLHLVISRCCSRECPPVWNCSG